MSTNLDYQQVIKNVYDEIENRLRVDTELTVSAGSAEVEIAAPDNIFTVGSEDGTTTGTQRVFVNNLRQQVLAAHDLIQSFTWLDFGTADERVDKIEFTSASITTSTVVQQFSYTLVSGKYRLDSITWSVV